MERLADGAAVGAPPTFSIHPRKGQFVVFQLAGDRGWLSPSLWKRFLHPTRILLLKWNLHRLPTKGQRDAEGGGRWVGLCGTTANLK